MEASYRAWLAGFFDGEGNISAHLNHGHPHPVISLVQKDRDILEGIRTAMGCGFISRFTSGVHILRFGGRDCSLRFLDAVEPYSIVKKEKIRVARELLLTIRPGQRVDPETRARRLVLAEQLRVRPRR